MNDMEVYLIGRDASQAPALVDWRKHYYDIIVPKYRRQPSISLQILGKAFPIADDGTSELELYLANDVSDPIYDHERKHSDDNLTGDDAKVPTPFITKTIKLSTNAERKTFVKQNRLARWTRTAISKIKEKEDKIAFQGNSTMGVNGFIGSDSKDLGAPAGKWDVDTGNNGILDKALADLITAKSYFTNKGFYKRPLHIALTSYAYDLLESTPLVQRPMNNLQLWYETLPKGSQIYASNNIQATVTDSSNSMCAFVQLEVEETTGEPEEGAYGVYSSGIIQGVHQTDIWEKRYGIAEKYTVKVMDDDYVAFMDAIDTTT